MFQVHSSTEERLVQMANHSIEDDKMSARKRRFEEEKRYDEDRKMKRTRSVTMTMLVTMTTVVMAR